MLKLTQFGGSLAIVVDISFYLSHFSSLIEFNFVNLYSNIFSFNGFSVYKEEVVRKLSLTFTLLIEIFLSLLFIDITLSFIF